MYRVFAQSLAGFGLASLVVIAPVQAQDYSSLFEQRYASPEDVGVLGRFVSKAVEVGQYDQAISTLEQHLVKYPRDARARLNLAEIYANTGSWELAGRNAEIAISVGDLTQEEVAQAEELKARVARAAAGFEWVLDLTTGIRSTWLDVKDENNEWKDRQDWNPFAAVNTALKIDLDTPLDDVLIVSASGLVERRYEDVNQGSFDPFDPGFDSVSGIHAHHQGRIAITLDKGVPVVELDALRFQFSAFGQFRTYNPSLVERALGTSIRMIVQPSVDTSFYAEGLYANLAESTNLTAEHRFKAEIGGSWRLTPEHTVGIAGRYQREFVDGGATVNRQREIELSYAGVVPFSILGVFWTQQASVAFGDFTSADGSAAAFLPFVTPGTGDYWRASWNHSFHLDGNNRIDFGYEVREYDYDLGAFAFFDPGSMVHTVSLSFTKSF